MGDHIDVVGEQYPQLPAGGYTERYPDNYPYGGRGAGLPGEGDGQLAPGKPQGFQQRQVAAPGPDGAGQGQGQGATAPVASPEARSTGVLPVDW